MTAHIKATQNFNINLFKELPVSVKQPDGNVFIDLDYGVKIVANQAKDFEFLEHAAKLAQQALLDGGK